MVNCSTYLSIYYGYSAFCSGSLPVIRVSILAARQYSTRYNFRTCTFKCCSQFRFTVQLAVVYWFRHHSLYSVITWVCLHVLVQNWNKHHWLSGPNEPILSRINQRTSPLPRLTTWSRPLLEDPVVSHTVKQISRMLWNLKFQHRVHKSLTLFPVLAVLPSNLFKIRFNIILSSSGMRFPNHNPECRSLPPNTCRTPESLGRWITVVAGRRCVSQTENRKVFQTCCRVVLLCYRSKDDQFTCCLNRQSVGMFSSLRCG